MLSPFASTSESLQIVIDDTSKFLIFIDFFTIFRSSTSRDHNKVNLAWAWAFLSKESLAVGDMMVDLC